MQIRQSESEVFSESQLQLCKTQHLTSKCHCGLELIQMILKSVNIFIKQTKMELLLKLLCVSVGIGVCIKDLIIKSFVLPSKTAITNGLNSKDFKDTLV